MCKCLEFRCVLTATPPFVGKEFLWELRTCCIALRRGFDSQSYATFNIVTQTFLASRAFAFCFVLVGIWCSEKCEERNLNSRLHHLHDCFRFEAAEKYANADQNTGSAVQFTRTVLFCSYTRKLQLFANKLSFIRSLSGKTRTSACRRR